MRSKRVLALLLAALAVASPAVQAQTPANTARAGPLALQDVLASARDHAPQVLEALARVRGAQGALLSREGAFDTVFSADAETRLTGFYGGTVAGASVSRPLPENGGYAYGGYRVSRGSFPSYEGEKFTNQAGELKAGAVFALMRDRAIDDRRFARSLAEADVAIADADRLMIAIGVQRRALDAYNAWVAAGLRLAIYKDLLALAEARQAGFKRQVAEGGRARIILTENEQNILRRQTLVVQTEQQLGQAAAALSLFWRDAAGNPIIPVLAQLPGTLPPLVRAAALAGAADPRDVIASRPDLRTIDIRLRQASQRLELDRNALLPKLDLKVEASRDFGAIGAGGISRSGTESKVGLTFSVPFEQRAARGRLAQTNAEIDAVKQRRRFLEDQIVAEIEALSVAVSATGRLRSIAADEQDRAATMAGAERRRFEAGASDFFLVNLREEAAADARVRALDAAIRNIAANAELAAVTADLDALGL